MRAAEIHQSLQKDTKADFNQLKKTETKHLEVSSSNKVKAKQTKEEKPEDNVQEVAPVVEVENKKLNNVPQASKLLKPKKTKKLNEPHVSK